MIKSHLLYQLSYAATRRGGDYGNDFARWEAWRDVRAAPPATKAW